MRNRGKLSEQSARFYASSVVYAFSVMHAKKIAYRDLKPENLVMDSNGYAKLVDFGEAPFGQDVDPLRDARLNYT